ncbi:MAG: GFA family protein, partial [Pseudomonadota bacterium]
GCACGAIRYESHAEIEFSFNCHCRKCQRATGTGHSSAFAVPVAETTITGTIKEYEAGSDNGAKTYAGFCEKCGSPVSSRTARFPERLYLHAATLDDPTIFHPKFIVYDEVAQPWDPPAHDLIDGAASP